ncbi:class I SAM-dependent methyltransferase [Gramella sp. AN32]|uniref:Class I SAM-dependent methyltransferase n=1 Tax=Christiangramia antarctica TaxID=2058158 RepID=A0ABW5X5N0_9FLAO|nr:class I SAM-dependent methyltransferase [Gramella sp. AN32]MCM4154776.1 class I SAM-dependent methyltransferase [Gramella sp. AN32]
MAEDPIGKQTLDVISQADAFNKWMYDTIKPFVKGRVLEIGSGIGNISELFIEDGAEIMLSDLRTEYCEILKAKYNTKSNFLGVEEIDLNHKDFESLYADHINSYDTVFALNVIEHIENDDLALKNCKKMLRPGGHLIILVPAFQKLYNQFDKNLGHFRRYTLDTLKNIFIQNKLSIIRRQYFNFAGIFGWYLSGKILKKESIPAGQMKLYNKMVPLFKLADIMTLKQVGLSVIVVGRKE